MSSTSHLTPESPPGLTPMTGDLFSSAPTMTTKVNKSELLKRLQSRRKQLVRQRRNALAQAAKARSGPDPKSEATFRSKAEIYLDSIRRQDARIDLLDQGAHKVYDIDLLDAELLVELGFGLDVNGNTPAL
jgi:hypothetical protein